MHLYHRLLSKSLTMHISFLKIVLIEIWKDLYEKIFIHHKNPDNKKNLSKDYTIKRKGAGLSGALKGLVTKNSDVIHAVIDLSFI